MGHPKTHNANITEASSLNKALTKTMVMNMLAVTNIPVAKDAKMSFMPVENSRFNRWRLPRNLLQQQTKKMSLGWKFAAHAASLDVENSAIRFAVTDRFALRGFGFPPFPTLAAENNARVFDHVVNCRRPWLHLGKGQ